MPYYLLLVGSPQEISFEVQQSLDLRYAVGRLAFDTPEEYHRYAQSVVAFESRTAQPDLRISLFGADHPGDRATHLMSTYLMPRLAAALAERPRGSHLETILGADATKARLAGRLTGPEGPAHLLFAAAHGLGFAAGSPLQRANQGALVCSDDCFAADDVPPDARLDGLIAFFFACHGAGTPSSEPGACGEEPRLVAPEPFVARLPQRLLASGALAVMGHVGRAWGYSYIWDGAGVHTAVFEDALHGLLAGQPIGHAIQPFNARYAELAADLGAMRRPALPEDTGCNSIVARLATATEDARNYVILGDPAVRLPSWLAM
jgi:hypothetical protein